MASIFVSIIVFVIAIALVAITASYAASAAAQITKVSKWSDNPKLASAHKYLSAAASVGWIYIGVVIALIILTLIFIEVEFSFIPAIIGFLNVLTVAVLVTTGILSAIGTSNIDQSGVTSSEVSSARSKALTATLVSLLSIGLLLIYYLVSFIISQVRKKKEKEQELIAFENILDIIK